MLALVSQEMRVLALLLLLVAVPRPADCGRRALKKPADEHWPAPADNQIGGAAFVGPRYLPPCRKPTAEAVPVWPEPTAAAPTKTTEKTHETLQPDTTTESSTASGRSDDLPQGAETAAPGVSRCVWAIVSCCRPDSAAIRYGCFEQLGCHGAFWGTSPCDRRIVGSALQAALQYYY